MQRVYYLDNNPQINIWEGMWLTRDIERELEACDIESPPRDLFITYLLKEGKIVDAGCGFGKWVIYLKRHGYDIVGIDDNETAITRLKEFDESLPVEPGDVLNVSYPDDSFDAYISMGVIEHFEEGPAATLSEAYRVLKPDGLIFVSVPTVNILRTIIRQPLRNVINALPKSLLMIRSNWGKSKRKAFLSAIGSLIPEKVKSVLIRNRPLYRHFQEYRYSKSELEGFLRQSGFEIITTVPHDLYGSKDHAIGLAVDFPFLERQSGANFQLNIIGKVISNCLDRVSPWIACSSVLCVGRSMKSK